MQNKILQIYTSDICLQASVQAISHFWELHDHSRPDFLFSSPESTSISFDLLSYNDGNIPSQMSINSTSGCLTFAVSEVSSDTNYSF